MEHEPAHGLHAVGASLMGLLLTGFGMAMLAAAALRETPLFWLNAGGYPVELRRWVLAFFYPALAAYVVWLVASTAVGCVLLRGGGRAAVVYLLAAALNWLLLAVTATVIVWNNVQNLLQGLPLHYHSR